MCRKHFYATSFINAMEMWESVGTCSNAAAPSQWQHLSGLSSHSILNNGLSNTRVVFHLLIKTSHFVKIIPACKPIRQVAMMVIKTSYRLMF